MTSTCVRVRADDKIISPRKLGISSKMKLPNHEPRLTRLGLVSLLSKAVQALSAISYHGIGMIVITAMILDQADGGGGKMFTLAMPY